MKTVTVVAVLMLGLFFFGRLLMARLFGCISMAAMATRGWLLQSSTAGHASTDGFGCRNQKQAGKKERCDSKVHWNFILYQKPGQLNSFLADRISAADFHRFGRL